MKAWHLLERTWLLALLLFVYCPLAPAQALAPRAAGAPTPLAAGTIRLLPASARIEPGESVTIEIWLDNVTDFYGLDLRFSFGPALVSVATAKVTPLWELFHPTNHLVIKNEANNVTGQVWYAITNINPAEPFSGSGRVATVTFQALAPGTTALTFTYAKGSTRNGEALYPVWAHGSIQVGPDPTGAIDGLVWEDHDRDGVRDLPEIGHDPIEPGLPGVTVALYHDGDSDGLLDPSDPLLASNTTDADGSFGFDALPLGAYLVDVTDTGRVLTHYLRTTPSGPTAVNISGNGQVTSVQFGYDWQMWIYVPIAQTSWEP